MTAHEIATVAELVYSEVAPKLGCHSLCREVSLIVLGICAAIDESAELVYEYNCREAGGGPRYRVNLSVQRAHNRLSEPRLARAPRLSPSMTTHDVACC